MQVIQEGRFRWYRETCVSKSITLPNCYYLYGSGISDNPVLLGTYTTRRAANFNRHMHRIQYIRARLQYKQSQ